MASDPFWLASGCVILIVLIVFPILAFILIREQVYVPYVRLMKSLALDRHDQHGLAYQFQKKMYVRFENQIGSIRLPVFVSASSQNGTSSLRIVSSYSESLHRNGTVCEESEARARIQALGMNTRLSFRENRIQFALWQPNKAPLTRQLVDYILNEFLSLYSDPYHASRLPYNELDMHLLQNADCSCMVCGEQVYEARVVCNSCNTPHHEECWSYFGGCSIFGCGCRNHTETNGTSDHNSQLTPNH